MPIRMHHVRSSTMTEVGYDRDGGTLVIRFVGGRLYAYPDVDESVYEGLIAADSKGAYFNLSVRPRFEGYQLRSG